MTDERLEALVRELSSDNQAAADELGDEAKRARESEAALIQTLEFIAGGEYGDCSRDAHEAALDALRAARGET